MKKRYFVYFMVIVVAFASCQKTTMSNLPQISFKYFGSATGADSIFTALMDTAYLQFNLSDGDADLGNTPPGPPYDIYINDMRFDTGYQGYMFPTIDQTIENAKKGITGICTFLFTPAILAARGDSIHTFIADTVYFKVYILDRSGNHSDTITTPKLYILP